MTAQPDEYREALDRARNHAFQWLESLATRPVAPQQNADEVAAHFRVPLQESAVDPAEVIDELAAFAEPGLMGMPSGRFFGWVIGGTLPAALASDWLVSAWDQNTGIRYATPATAAIEEAAEDWLLDLLGFDATSGVGFTTGATMANFVGLAAGRKKVLDDVGWDVQSDGLSGSPRITVLAGAESHASIDMALRYLGLGLPVPVAADHQGRIRVDALAEALDAASGPIILCLQAGNLHSGSFDPFREAIELAHARGAWVHVDGAFGLWAAASPAWASAVDGLQLADSWATDAHKTLNVPYDCGVAIVSDRALLRSAFGVHTDYLIHDAQGDPFERVPEFSRRARGIPVWAALRSLGRQGTIALVDGLARNARDLAHGLGALPGVEVLNEVVFTQVCLSFGTDERTRTVTRALIADGAVWMSGSRWQGREVLRISVSNWSTDATDVAASIDAVRRAMAAAD
ncbi:pyridoxal phosphate-dependent decarboxylase family protein [Mycetocola sp.]|uniref:pyridoxal phosphate-dependent decarboxylase family protein n=1 Tax=Mycetocola sp. TaxID=1871042 RepID=UPI0039895F1F